MALSREDSNRNIEKTEAENEKKDQVADEIREMCLAAAARYRALASSINTSTSAQPGDAQAQETQHEETPFKFKPAIYADNRNQLDIEKVIQLRELYKQGEEKGARMLRALNHRPTFEGVGEVDEKRRNLNRCAVYALIKEETDRQAAVRGLVQPDPRFTPEAVEILEEFFKISQTPNPAEIAYLAQSSGLGREWVIHWFKEKLERMKPVILARAAIPMDGPLGQQYKKEMQEKYKDRFSVE